jgi:hypothetical protein
MEYYLWQLAQVAKQHAVPIVYPGDVFHYWQSIPELVNFAIKHLPPGYAIPGQHDLPLHNYEDVNKSAYWTLVQAGVLTHLNPGVPTAVKGTRLVLYGFPYGWRPVTYTFVVDESKINLAVVHEYCWCEGHTFPGVSRKKHVNSHAFRLKNFTAAVFGDNHKRFLCKFKKENYRLKSILNGGCFIRQKSDEINLRPVVGLLRGNGRFYKHFLDVSKDEFVQGTEEFVGSQDNQDLDDFVLMLKADKESDPVNFDTYVQFMMEQSNCSDEVRKVVLEALEDGDES